MKLEITYNKKKEHFEMWRIDVHGGRLCWECETSIDVEELIRTDLDELKADVIKEREKQINHFLTPVK